MTTNARWKPRAFAILTMAEIKAAADGFDKGETNLYEALDAIAVAIDAYRAAALARRKAA
jgi:hypothetical protein